MSDRNERAGDEARALEIVRIFDAPRALVFQAWVDPERMKQWSAPHGYSIGHNEGEVRPGARWRSCMLSPEGEELWLGGAYREVVEDERLVFTQAWEREDGSPGHETVITVSFEDAEGGKTKMIFRQAFFESQDDRDGHAGGWGECFERLDDLLAAEVRA